VVADEEPSGAMRAVATADFGNGLSWILPGDWLFINPDLTVHLLREPVGEWICLAARTLPSSIGVGIAESAIYDERGRVGRSVQSLLIDSTR
jgi:Thioesterase-like superfamily